MVKATVASTPTTRDGGIGTDVGLAAREVAIGHDNGDGSPNDAESPGSARHAGRGSLAAAMLT